MYWFTAKTLRRARYSIIAIVIGLSIAVGAFRLGGVFGDWLGRDHQYVFSRSWDLALLVAASVATPILLFVRVSIIRAEMRAAVIKAVLRHLYHQVFGRASGHRVTFLAQTRPGSHYVRPRYRYAFGQGFYLRSRSRFRRGSAVAGMAWREPGKPFIVRVPEFFPAHDKKPRWWRLKRRWWGLYTQRWMTESERNFLEFARGDLRMSERDVRRLGWRTQHQRWLLSYATEEGLILSLDSSDSGIEVEIRNIENAMALISEVCADRQSSGWI